MNATCQSCRAPIRWCVTETGKAIPVDYTPRRDGNLVLVDHGDRVVASVAPSALPLLAPVTPITAVRYVSHFATCPHAARHRRRAS